MNAATADWTPPHQRRDEVEGDTSPQTAHQKWFVYSKTYQGIAAMAVTALIGRYFKIELDDANAQMLAEQALNLIVTVLLGVGMWWTKKGRQHAEALIYWMPKSRKDRIAAATGIPKERLHLK